MVRNTAREIAVHLAYELSFTDKTAEELVATAKAAHAKNLFDDLVRRLRATAKVAYPHGKDLFTRRTSTTPSKKKENP